MVPLSGNQIEDRAGVCSLLRRRGALPAGGSPASDLREEHAITGAQVVLALAQAGLGRLEGRIVGDGLRTTASSCADLKSRHQSAVSSLRRHEMLRLAVRRDRGGRERLARVAVRIGRRGTNEIGAHRAAAKHRQDHAPRAGASLD
jgi:hypothetical protein